MAKKDGCAICKHMYHQVADIPVFPNQVFLEGGRIQRLYLCFLHDLEYFKIGQYRFIEKYRYLADNVIVSDDAQFISLLRTFGLKKVRRSSFF